MEKMTARERGLAFYHHQPTDELPTDNDLFVLFNPEAYSERPDHTTGGTDWFGVTWKYEASVDAIAPDHSQAPVLEDICDWKELVKFPDLDAWDWSRAETIDHVSELDRTKVFVMMFVNGPFERMHMLMGFENALCALLTDPDEVENYLNAYMEWKLKLMKKVIEIYRPDVLMFHDDWGTQSDMFFSPELWRKFFKPQIQKAVDLCHEMGCIFEMHSCGKIESVVPDFVEMGIDAWQGMEINDIPKLKSITKDKLSYHTTPDYQKYYTDSLAAGFVDEEKIRAEVRDIFYKSAEGYCYSPMFLPFGGEAANVMWDEVWKCGKTVYNEK